MIGYTTLGTNDLDRATDFYDKLFADEDVKQMQPNERLRLWARKGSPMFGVIKPYDGKPASVGNGNMIALSVENPEKVQKLYALALELGATDDGAPGPRGTGGFYGGYFRDLDGHKLVVFCRVS
jgi:catechol 2,3-dioxygenase-like lactoylglutathione lyase family enzyme